MELEYLADRFKPTLQEELGNLAELYVFIDGRFVKGKEAFVSVYDHGFLYGDGIFEGIRAYDGKVFKLEEHIDRLFDSARALNISKIALTKEEIKETVVRTLRINNLKNAHIRVIVTRGAGRPGVDPQRAVRPTIIVSAYPFPPLLGEKPVKLITSSIRRKSPHSVDSKIKSLNYLDNVLAKLQANAVQADDAIMLDMNGFLAEGTGENIFVVKGKAVSTPRTIAALHGITRDTIMRIASKLGYEVAEKDLTLHDLYTADEVLLTGTGAEVTSVAEVDGRKIGKQAPGPATEKIREAYAEMVRKEHVTEVYS